MHRVTVVFGPTALGFMFRTKEKAETHKNFRTDHPTQDLIVDDDFGQHAEIKAMSIHGIIVEDMDQAKVAQVELMLHNTRVQHAAQQRAQSDPALSRNGPRVLSPIPGGMNGMG